MPSLPPEHKDAVHQAESAKRLARAEIRRYRRERTPLLEALDEIERHYRQLPKRGE